MRMDDPRKPDEDLAKYDLFDSKSHVESDRPRGVAVQLTFPSGAAAAPLPVEPVAAVAQAQAAAAPALASLATANAEEGTTLGQVSDIKTKTGERETKTTSRRSPAATPSPGTSAPHAHGAVLDRRQGG
mmetsp:Transcript_1537/g.5639  ORF Transcript_1537/g.5639 Transcript_1537/m.5639 type:complete len:129 (+) Transcript_1537:34-420(+)